jgi:drug/metabolite transporter (DMT)-like permease
MAGSAGPGPVVLAPLGAALCYGVASVLQQLGARRADGAAGVDGKTRRISFRLVFELARQPQFLLGLGLDAVGFTLAFVGLRHLPVFVVQATVASTVAVTAVLGTRFLDDHLRRRDWLLVGTVVVGLALVGGTAADGDRPSLSWFGTTLLVAGAPAMALAGLAVDRRSARRTGPRSTGRGGDGAAAALGAVSGIGFGGFALAGRLLPAHDDTAGLLTDPVLWAAVLYAVLGLGLYGVALQRGSVTAVTATTITTEALFPSAVGLLFLADRTRPGLAFAAVAGFVLTVGGALALAVSKSAAAPVSLAEPAPSTPGRG